MSGRERERGEARGCLRARTVGAAACLTAEGGRYACTVNLSREEVGSGWGWESTEKS